MIDFDAQDKALILRYRPENAEPDWLVEPLETGEPVPLSSRTFFVRKKIYLPEAPNKDGPMDALYQFTVGEKVAGGYYRMDRRVLDIDYDLFLHESLDFKRTTFVAETNIPIFRAFKKHGFSSFYIGGGHADALPKAVFEELLRQFPTTTELKKYARARVSSMIRSYVPLERDFQAEYTKFRNRKRSPKGSQPTKTFAAYETDKFLALVSKLETMLKRAETYSEAQWQAEILQVIQLLYPKYVAAFTGAPVRDSLAGKNREIDYLLVDASGYVDAAEIKQPFSDCVVTSTRYRDNHVPMRELNGTVMQLEKYLYHLNRWGGEGERKLNERYGEKLPAGLTIKIVNPSGLIILGRDEALTADQRSDFEVIRRKYRHVVDIMTYDDLLRRLRVIARHFSSTAPEGA